MSDFSGKTKVNSEDGFAKDPGTDVVISTNDADSDELVSAYDLNTETESTVDAVEVVNEGIDPNDPLPGIHKGIKSPGVENIDDSEVEEARAQASGTDAAPADATVTNTSEVPEGTIKDVLAWVDGDADKAKLALAAEEKGEKRATLITKLNEVK